MAYEWDDEKNRTNRRKHGVDFADAVSALEDDEALTMDDDDSDEEDRFVTLGMDSLGRLLVVVHTWRGENIRMISAVKPLAGKGRRTRANDEKAIRFFES